MDPGEETKGQVGLKSTGLDTKGTKGLGRSSLKGNGLVSLLCVEQRTVCVEGLGLS